MRRSPVRTIHTRSFSRHSFSEILLIHASQLVNKIKEESKGNAESKTKKQLLEKIASFSQQELAHAKDPLAMIWNGTTGPVDPNASKPKSNTPTNPTFSSKSRRVEVALLKSISTGVFIDVQFYAYNAIGIDLHLDPKPLFTSSIVIKEWKSAITKRKLQGSSLFVPL